MAPFRTNMHDCGRTGCAGRARRRNPARRLTAPRARRCPPPPRLPLGRNRRASGATRWRSSIPPRWASEIALTNPAASPRGLIRSQCSGNAWLLPAHRSHPATYPPPLRPPACSRGTAPRASARHSPARWPCSSVGRQSSESYRMMARLPQLGSNHMPGAALVLYGIMGNGARSAVRTEG